MKHHRVIDRKKLNYNDLVPGQIYRINRSGPCGYYIRNNKIYYIISNCIAKYKKFYVIINCKSGENAYSPISKYVDFLINDIVVKPTDIKIGDVITFRRKSNPNLMQQNLIVTKIAYSYVFSSYHPHYLPITTNPKYKVDSNHADIYHTMQTIIEQKSVKQLPLIDDVIGVIGSFIS
jgi:hypothetical protein